MPTLLASTIQERARHKRIFVRRPLIVDCLIFLNELEVLSFRISQLKEVVDYFVIVESPFTFVGEKKDCLVAQKLESFGISSSRIINIVFDDPPVPHMVRDGRQWINEEKQRDSIVLGLDYLDYSVGLKSNDLILISDCDEIPDIRAVKAAHEQLNYSADFSVSFEMDTFFYDWNHKLNIKWNMAKATLWKKIALSHYSISDIRRRDASVISPGGWHLSYFGGSDQIAYKLRNFSHQEPEFDRFKLIESIQESIDKSLDIVRRKNIEISINDFSYMPDNYQHFFGLS